MESKHMTAAHLLRATSTSPTIGSRPPHGIPHSSLQHTSQSLQSSSYTSPSTSPFMQPQRRSPRSQSPFQSSAFGSPSPSLNALQTQSPNMFSLPSPSLLGMTPNLTSSTRTNEGGLSLNQSHMLLGGSQIFANWEGESIIRRSPRFTPQHAPLLSASRRSPSFTMFSPAGNSQQPSAYNQLHHQPMDMSSAAASNNRRNNVVPYSPAMNSVPVPSSPNLSILGKLRSLHHSGSAMNDDRSVSPSMKLEDPAMPRSTGKRARTDYESHSSSPYHSTSPSPAPHHTYYNQTPMMNGMAHKNTPHFGGTGGYSLTSPAMVGSLPPSQHSMSMVDVPSAHESEYDSSHSHASHSPKHTKSAVTPKKTKAHSKKEPRGGKPKPPPQEVAYEDSTTSPELESSAPNLSNGSGSSCHQCKSRRLIVDLVYCCNMWKKGADRKVAATATSSAQHSCRKKYCGNCLTKFYSERAPAKRSAHNSEFVCPACRGICCCAACRRIKARQHPGSEEMHDVNHSTDQGQLNESTDHHHVHEHEHEPEQPQSDINPSELPPAKMLAYSYVYCEDVLKSAMGENDNGNGDETEDDEPPTQPASSSSYNPYASLQAAASSTSPQATGLGKGKNGGGKTRPNGYPQPTSLQDEQHDA